MIVRFNESKLFPSQIESKILTISGVTAVAVVSAPDVLHEFGNVPFAFIKLSSNVSKRKVSKELKKLANIDVLGYSGLFDYCFIEDIPINKSGKVDYRKLEDIAKDRIKKHKTFY